MERMTVSREVIDVGRLTITKREVNYVYFRQFLHNVLIAVL